MGSKVAPSEPGNFTMHGQGCWLGVPVVAWAILFAIASNVPFVNQPYHMDDGIYLLMARNVLHKPLFPQDVPVLFEGLYGQDLASTEHPWPFTSYYAALIAIFGGFSEASLHVGFLLFPMVLAWGMYSLSRDLTRRPALATLSLLALPVVSVSSHTLMTDIPLMAIWLSAVVLFRRGLDSGHARLLWAGSITAALACLVTCSGICLVVLLLFYSLLRRKSAAALIIVSVPVGVLAALFATYYVHYQRFTPGTLVSSYLYTKRVFSPELLLEKSAFVILALGAVTVSPLFALFSHGYRVILGVMAASIAVVLTAPPVSDYSPAQKVLLIVFCWGGLCLLIRVTGWTIEALGSLRNRSEPRVEDLFLGLWVLGVVLFCVAAYMTGSARHLLPAMPPLILILFRFIEQRWERPARPLALANLALCALAAAALSLADFEMAKMYRDFADTMSRSFPRRAGRMWFTGEWGFRTYLEQAGGRELGRRDGRAAPGDLLVVPSLATPYATLYGGKLGLHTIALAAPSSIAFAIPPVPSGSSLIYTIGMPFFAASDGMQFAVRFVSDKGDHVLSQERITPGIGRSWRVLELSLPETAQRGGSIVLEAGVGEGGDANADWVAISRARIALRTANRERVLYDFQQHLHQAQIRPVSGVIYHTRGNLPVLPMDVWLDQTPATVLLSRHEYTPRLPLRLLDSGSHAGFWSSSWGFLPFSFAGKNTVLESISIYEVIRAVDDYGERAPSWYEE